MTGLSETRGGARLESMTTHLALVPPVSSDSLAFARVARLIRETFSRFGTEAPPSAEEMRALSYEVMSALVLARLRGNRAEQDLLQDALDVTIMVDAGLRGRP